MRLRARVEGTVQGVGFRPYVYRLAGELGVAGHVLNDSRGVVVEVEAAPETVDRFLARLPAEAPPLAHVERVVSEPLQETGEHGFVIRESPRDGEPRAAVTPDSATCPDCLAELFDPGDRRFRYPFTNCTNCGPRFTIVRNVPYDRPHTTMAGFTMCAACRREYEDPNDRRFHAPAERVCRLRAARRARPGRWLAAGRSGCPRPRPGGGPRPAPRRDRRHQGDRGASISRVGPTTRPWSPSCGRASTARTGRSR